MRHYKIAVFVQVSVAALFLTAAGPTVAQDAGADDGTRRERGDPRPDPLDAPRKLIAVAVLLVFILTFTPLPMRLIAGELPSSELSGATCLLVLPALMVGAAMRLARRAKAG